MRGAVILMALATLPAQAQAPSQAQDIYIGDWNGLVPHSMQILNDQTLKICREDLTLQCQYPIPYSRQGEVIVVENFSAGLRWTYTPRPGGGYDARYDRWDGEGRYDTLATAILRAR
ncbi:MAG: hypothetical protein AAGB15_12485 [Pseudomonadota bacterium]